MKKYLLCLSVILSFMVTCRKDKAPAVLVNGNTGSITGIIHPANAILSVTTINTSSRDTTSYTAKPDTSGAFTIKGLPPGTYSIRFNPSPNVVQPADTLVTVRANEVTNLGIINISTKTGSISGTVFPSKAVSSITINNGTNVYSTTPDSTGHFVFPSLMPAYYSISFTVAANFRPVKDTSLTIAAGQNINIGLLAPKPFSGTNNIDTITGTEITETQLLARAPYDSLIVIIGDLVIFSEANTDSLKEALNKIVIITGYMDVVSDITLQSITMNKIIQMGAFLTSSQANLTSISFPALTSLLSIELWNTPLLTSLNLGSLQQLKGSVSFYNTGFSNLDMFNTVTFKPTTLDLENNKSLTRICPSTFSSDSVYNLSITGNPLVTSLDGIQSLKRVMNKITISNNATLQSLKGMNNIAISKMLEINSNPQLTDLCPAKNVVNAVKNLPPFKVLGDDGVGGWVWVTVDPFVASNDGSYSTEADVVAAVAQCP